MAPDPCGSGPSFFRGVDLYVVWRAKSPAKTPSAAASVLFFMGALLALMAVWLRRCFTESLGLSLGLGGLQNFDNTYLSHLIFNADAYRF